MNMYLTPRVQVWCHRFGYVTINVLLLVWLWSFRGSWLVDREGNTEGGMASVLVLLVLASSIAFAAVQGSNPGYVYGGESYQSRTSRNANQHTVCAVQTTKTPAQILSRGRVSRRWII